MANTKFIERQNEGIEEFIAVIPAIQDVESFKNLLVNKEHKIKGCIIIEDKDYFFKIQ